MAFARRDAYFMREYAIKMLGVPSEQAFLLVDDQATKSEIQVILEDRLQQQVQAGDTVYVYFAGHGLPEVRDVTPYRLPADGDPQSPRLSAYALNDFYTALGRLRGCLRMSLREAKRRSNLKRSGVNSEIASLLTVARNDTKGLFEHPLRAERVLVFLDACFMETLPRHPRGAEAFLVVATKQPFDFRTVIGKTQKISIPELSAAPLRLTPSERAEEFLVYEVRSK